MNTQELGTYSSNCTCGNCAVGNCTILYDDVNTNYETI